jgi:large subunit ribosomal protein L11
MPTIKVLVEAGKANAGPPIGPALGPLGVNTMDIVNAINQETKHLEGIEIPIKIHIDSKKKFSIELGSPQTSALIKKELNLKKGASKVNEEVAGNLTFDQVLKIVNAKYSQLVSKSKKSSVKEILGSCRSMGINVDNLPAQEIINKVNLGEFDSKLN